MAITPAQFAPLPLASATIRAARGRVAYVIASGLDPAQARREAMTGIGRAVSYDASVIGSVDMLVLLGLTLVVALAIALGLKRDPYSDAARPGLAFLAYRLPHDPR